MGPNDAKSEFTPALSKIDQERLSFVSDDHRVAEGGTVAIAISVGVDIRDGTRTRGGVVSIHEIPLLRRIYPEGSMIELRTEWQPAIDRRVFLTRDQLVGDPKEGDGELQRLRRSYVIPLQGGGRRDLLQEVFGGESPEALLLNIQRKINTVAEAWMVLERTCLDRLCAKLPAAEAEALRAAYRDRTELVGLISARNRDPSIAVTPEIYRRWHAGQSLHGRLATVLTREDLEALVTLVEPHKKAGVEHIDLPEIQLPSEASLLAGAKADAGTAPAGGEDPLGLGGAGDDEGDGDAVDALIAALRKADVPERTANEIAVLAEDRGAGMSDEDLVATSEGWFAKQRAKRIEKVRAIIAAHPLVAPAAPQS